MPTKIFTAKIVIAVAGYRPEFETFAIPLLGISTLFAQSPFAGCAAGSIVSSASKWKINQTKNFHLNVIFGIMVICVAAFRVNTCSK